MTTRVIRIDLFFAFVWESLVYKRTDDFYWVYYSENLQWFRSIMYHFYTKNVNTSEDFKLTGSGDETSFIDEWWEKSPLFTSNCKCMFTSIKN